MACKLLEERIVEAEANSREKKFGAVGAALSNFGLDKGSIEENQLRIWEELKAKQASGAKPRKRTEAEAAPAPGPFAGLKKAWDEYVGLGDEGTPPLIGPGGGGRRPGGLRGGGRGRYQSQHNIVDHDHVSAACVLARGARGA